jgi:hypothetical protein
VLKTFCISDDEVKELDLTIADGINRGTLDPFESKYGITFLFPQTGHLIWSSIKFTLTISQQVLHKHGKLLTVSKLNSPPPI